MLARLAPGGTSGAGPSVSFESGAAAGAPACDGGVGRLAEIRIGLPACGDQVRADLRQRLRGPARLGAALHDGADAIHLDAIAGPRGAALETGLLTRRDDLRARPPAWRLREQRRIRAHQDHGGAQDHNSRTAWQHRHCSRFEPGWSSRGEVSTEGKPFRRYQLL